MISGFIDFLRQFSDSANSFGYLMFILVASTGIGMFFMIFRFIKSFNIFN